jgi:HTH domain
LRRDRGEFATSSFEALPPLVGRLASPSLHLRPFRIGLRSHVQEVDGLAVDGGGELREPIEPRLLLAPIVAGPPLARRDWVGHELADRLQVITRTTRNDVERLPSLGYPVHAGQGVAGGSVAGIEETAVRALAKIEQIMQSRLHRYDRATRPLGGTR